MDSSLVVVPPAVGRPLRLLPFRGWRLTPGRIGDPATARLFARPYRDVAERLDRWREAGQLLEDHRTGRLRARVHRRAGSPCGAWSAPSTSPTGRPSTDDRTVVPHEGIHPDQVDDLADRMSTLAAQPRAHPPRAPRPPVRPRARRPGAHQRPHPRVRRPRRPAAPRLGDPRPRRSRRPQRRPGRLARPDRRRPPQVRGVPADAAAGARRRQRPWAGDAGRPGRHPAVPGRDPPHAAGHLARRARPRLPAHRHVRPGRCGRRVRRVVARHPGGHRRRELGHHQAGPAPGPGRRRGAARRAAAGPRASPTGGSGSTTRSTRRSAGSARHRASRS